MDCLYACTFIIAHTWRMRMIRQCFIAVPHICSCSVFLIMWLWFDINCPIAAAAKVLIAPMATQRTKTDVDRMLSLSDGTGCAKIAEPRMLCHSLPVGFVASLRVARVLRASHITHKAYALHFANVLCHFRSICIVRMSNTRVTFAPPLTVNLPSIEVHSMHNMWSGNSAVICRNHRPLCLLLLALVPAAAHVLVSNRRTWKRTKQYDSIAIGAVNVCVCCAVCCIVLYSLKLSSLAVASLCLCSPLRQLVILWSLLNEGIVMRHMLRSGDYITEHNNRRIIHALYLCLSMQIMNCEFPKAKHWNTTQ